MRFLVDAHLPSSLCALIKDAGHDVVHTHQLLDQNRTKDKTINLLSIREQRVVITKDTGFFYSHLLNQGPWKLLLVRAGNIRTRDLKELFAKNLPDIIQALEDFSLVELDQKSLRILR